MPEPVKNARFEIPPDLRFLLKRALRTGIFDYTFTGPQSAKHLVESLGIPHTEVSFIRVNGESCSLDYLVQDGDCIQVFSQSANKALIYRTPGEPRFVLDGHLGRLAAYLRMLGLDCLYRNDYTDPELVQVSVSEGRILLTRDRRLLMHKTIQHGCLLRSLDPGVQFTEIIQRFALKHWIKPFQRCLLCNHVLQPVEKEVILDRLQPLTIQYFDEFHLCPGCNQVYWKGSHYERMLRLVIMAGRLADDMQLEPPTGS